MNIFEQFLNKISHKFSKGYPDMNNEQDISLLESLVSEVLGEDIKLNEGLSATELQKRTPRIPKFIEKLINSSPFELEDGGTITLSKVNIDGVDFNKSSSQDSLTQALTTAKKITVTGDSNGKPVTLSSGKLKKSEEFVVNNTVLVNKMSIAQWCLFRLGIRDKPAPQYIGSSQKYILI
jgi:hypothetical protein